jgi:hypothetical protein
VFYWRCGRKQEYCLPRKGKDVLMSSSCSVVSVFKLVSGTENNFMYVHAYAWIVCVCVCVCVCLCVCAREHIHYTFRNIFPNFIKLCSYVQWSSFTAVLYYTLNRKLQTQQFIYFINIHFYLIVLHVLFITAIIRQNFYKHVRRKLNIF